MATSISPKGAGAPLNILLASDGGAIEGNVQTADGKPSAGTEITVAPSDEYSGRSDLLESATNDAAGNFQAKDVAPGDYRVYAWEIDLDQSPRSAEFRKLFDPKSAAVRVGPNALILDDGEQQQREFGLEAELGGQKLIFVVPAAQFGRMGWVLRQLGPQAIIYPGQQQHARAAIQCLSGSIQKERIFTHLGWRNHEGHWVYLHAGGAVGAQGPRGHLRVKLPTALRRYEVHAPADRQEQANAVRASLRCLSVAPDWISFPLLAAVYRAALGKVDFSVFLAGQTGVFKSALAALCQQHFGAAMDARGLPTNFASTGNALTELAFYAKDALLVVDDFAPTGRHSDHEVQNVAERLLRATGNQQGRAV